MKDVRAALDPEEPDYSQAAKLGPPALPHLEALVNSGEAMLASKATYLASLIKDPKATDIVAQAARSDDPIVRVAAAAAASNLPAAGTSTVLEELVVDRDAGVRKVARASVPDKPNARLAERLQQAPAEPDAATEGAVSAEATSLVTGLMPGETSGDMPGGTTSTMPGERPGRMAGEQHKMPGE